MRKKIITLALLSLLLIGCNKTSDTEATEATKTSDTGGKTTDTSKTDTDTGKETDTDADKDALYKEFIKGFNAFFQNDQDVTYETIYTATVDDLDGTTNKMKDSVKGTINRTDGLAYSLDTVYLVDPSTNEETEYGSSSYYIGLGGGNYKYFVGDGSNKKIYNADKNYVNYFYNDHIIDNFGLDEMKEMFVNTTTFTGVTAALKYSFSSFVDEMITDISETEDGIVFSFEIKADSHEDYYFSKITGGYSYTVKDGYLSKMNFHSLEKNYYPNGKKSSDAVNMEVSFKKGFDETFYKTFNDFSSYFDTGEGAPFSFDVYYEDYYYTTLYCKIGEDISLSTNTSSDLVDGLYFDKDYKTAYTEKKCSSDITEMYVKLKTTAPSTKAIVYELTDKTVLYYDNVLPTTVNKRLSASAANASYVKYSWVHSDEEKRELANETITVNGVKTTEDGINVQVGVVYLIQHSYSTYIS